MEINLGLCQLPAPIYLYVKNIEVDGRSHCWYYYDPNTKITTPEPMPGVCGYLSELRISTSEYREKTSTKLNITVSAGDRTYTIRSGIETNFTKGFLLAVSAIADLTKPLIIGCSPGNENVVFCNVYDASTKARIKSVWDANADWISLIEGIQEKLGNSLDIEREEEAIQGNGNGENKNTLLPNATRKSDRSSLMKESDRLITILGWNDAHGKEYLEKNYGGKTARSQLSDAELITFVGKLQTIQTQADQF